MFYLKNDDMEELFRSAAENYEVDTGKASDWEAVYNAVHNDPPGGDMEEVKKKKKRRFIFWWFLLFPAGWIAHNTWVNIGTGSFKNRAPVITDNISREGVKGNEAAPEIRQKDELRGQRTMNNKNDPAGSHSAVSDQFNTGISIQMSRKQQQVDNTTGFNKNKQLFIPGENMPAGVNARYDEGREPKEAHSAISAGLQKVELPGSDHPLPVDALQIPQTTGITALGNEQVAPQTVKKNEIKKNIHYFYLEGMAAPDLTTVRFQRISGTGSSFGLLAGYRMNKRLHIEAGAFLEKKLYYTEGAYFDKSKLSPYYQNVKMLYVDGNCKMITVPLNIRYNVVAGQRSNWFVAAGMSSYFMNREYYDYTYQHGSGPPVTRGYSYKISQQNWMTVINFNVGYERTLWRKYNFRMEPYFRLPVSGVGTGNLLLNSGGIYLGVGRRF